MRSTSRTSRNLSSSFVSGNLGPISQNMAQRRDQVSVLVDQRRVQKLFVKQEINDKIEKIKKNCMESVGFDPTISGYPCF